MTRDDAIRFLVDKPRMLGKILPWRLASLRRLRARGAPACVVDHALEQARRAVAAQRIIDERKKLG